ncbi:MAG: uroporphyrinogen decarboxylase family protein [Candidatus Contubernalis sp.]|nr:uroporphyrinogen decarboxylase family protein [Candidatus Contubernalis sp.]
MENLNVHTIAAGCLPGKKSGSGTLGSLCWSSLCIFNRRVSGGSEVIGIVDPVASQVNPVIFKEFEVPACQPALKVIKEAGYISSFLTCGDSTKVMEEICRLGVDSFSCDEQVSLTFARDLALKYGLGFTGSLNVAQSLTLGLIDPGKDTLVSMAAGGMTGYILAPGLQYAL